MNMEEFIWKCQAIMLKEEEENTVAVIDKMRAKGVKITTNCLVGKILLTRGVNLEGLISVIRQVWRSIKEVKIESMGSNVFLFKFDTEENKRRVLTGGPWHFDRALIVFSEPNGIGDIQKQSFTHATFWVQFHNVPIMCMHKEAIQELGEKVGTVEEVDMDEDGECIRAFARARISIDITLPLRKIIFLKLEEEIKIPIVVLYEKLPDF